MPFDLFPATRSMDGGKRKRGDDDAENQKNSAVNGGKEDDTATDEEVEEFFAILRRLHSATKSIKKIDGASRLLIGNRSKPISMASDEEAGGIKIGGDKTPEHHMERSLGLDLNLEPASTESDAKERRSRSQDLKSSSSPDSAALQK